MHARRCQLGMVGLGGMGRNLMLNMVDHGVAVAGGLNLETVARIWRGGCIIRAALLEKIRTAYRARADLPNLLVDPALARDVTATYERVDAKGVFHTEWTRG